MKAPTHTKDAFINGRKPAPFVPLYLMLRVALSCQPPLFFTYPLGKLGLALWKKGPTLYTELLKMASTFQVF